MAARRGRRSTKTTNKKTASKRKAKIEVLPVATPIASNFPQGKVFSKQVLIGALVLALSLLAFYKKHWFVTATVNGMPITSVETVARLYTDYRSQAVNELIDEKVIMAEAKKSNSVPSQDEVNARMAELETQVGGSENLNNLLAQEGTSRTSLERRMKMRLALEKIYSNEATVSTQEISDFVSTNRAQLTATGSAEQSVEAEKIIRQNKLGQVINQKFAELREKANIKIF